MISEVKLQPGFYDDQEGNGEAGPPPDMNGPPASVPIGTPGTAGNPMGSPNSMGAPMNGPLQMNTPFGGPGPFGEGEPVPKAVHDELLRKYSTLRTNYSELERKYLKLKDMYKQSKDNHGSDLRKLQEKIRKLEGGRVENVVLPDETKKNGENDEERPEIGIEVQNPKYQNKDHINVKDAGIAIIRTERDIYKTKTNELKQKLEVAQRERSDANIKNKDLTKKLSEIQEGLEKIQREKIVLEEKIRVLESGAHKSPIGSPYNSDDEANPTDELRSMYKRKEYYKNKYQLLLEEQNREQRNFLLVNKRLLEQYVFK
jgi:chromosome segregation ATPase